MKEKSIFGFCITCVLSHAACCWVPAIFYLVGGLSGSATFLTDWIKPIEPYLFILSYTVLGISFYQIYGNHHSNPCEHSGCSDEKEKKKLFFNKLFLWLMLLFVLFSTFKHVI